MAQRIKGQETEVMLVVDGSPQATITTIKSFEMTWQLEKSSEGFLGETTDRKDSVFKGISGSLDMQLENADAFGLVVKIVDKARRRTPGTKINIKTTLNFPNGDRPRIMIPNVEFGDIPLNLGGRTEFVTMKLDFEASEAQRL